MVVIILWALVLVSVCTIELFIHALAPGFGCMIHHTQNSERHEIFGVKEFKKQQ